MMPSDLSLEAAQNTSTFPIRKGILLGIALIAGTGIASMFEYISDPSYPGSLQTRTTLITSSCLAQVSEISVKVGQSIAPGDPLIQLVDSRLEDRMIAKRREIAELEAEVDRVKIAAEVDWVWRRRELQSEAFETQLKESTLVQERLNKQVEQLAWNEHLSLSESSVSPMVAEIDHPFRSISQRLQGPDDRRLQAMLREDAAASTAETLTTQIALCEERLTRLAALEKDLENKIRAGSGVAVIEARLIGARKELEAMQTQSNELILASPAYGTVGDVKVHSGDQVPAGEALISILDDAQLHVVAQIPPGIAARLNRGSKVTLVFPENDKRIGIIAEIPSQVASAGAYVPVKIEPAGKLWPKLAIGSGVKILLP